ncbi:MAG: site-2 protease family protein [Candidatus Yanofskybacteria bacterium]|nr:site-2 protease family protein [Candidatus Yanofskybacteria bacterium]
MSFFQNGAVGASQKSTTWSSIMETLLTTIFWIVALLYSVVIHEVSHGAVAYSLGDGTAKNLGRLTLNPIKHLDMFGSVLLPLLLVILRSPFVFGYAKPVPYNPLNLSDRKYGPAKVAIAGPASNIALAVLFGLTLRFLPDVFSSSLIPELLGIVVTLNLFLAIFNLFPIPPLDGHWLLLTFLPARFTAARMFLYKYSFLLLLVLLFFIFPLLIPVIRGLFQLLTGIGF